MTHFCAVYFPFTWMSRPVLDTLLRVFAKVVVYQPVGCPALEDLDPWVTQGRLDIRVPLAGTTDEQALAAGVKDMQAWAALHPDTDMAYLKYAADDRPPSQPLVPELASRIKGPAMQTSRPIDDPDFASQLFLLLAHDHDQHLLDMDKGLRAVAEKNLGLEAFFRLDSPDDPPIMPQGGRPVDLKSDPGAIMTAGRVSAWTRLFCHAPVQPAVLVTDSPAAWNHIFQDLDDLQDLGCFQIGDTQYPTAEKPVGDSAALLFTEVLTRPWDPAAKKETAQAFERVFSAHGSGSLEAQARQGPKPTLRLDVIPETDPVALLMRRCGIRETARQAPGVFNTLLGLLDLGLTSIDAPESTAPNLQKTR